MASEAALRKQAAGLNAEYDRALDEKALLEKRLAGYEKVRPADKKSD